MDVGVGAGINKIDESDPEEGGEWKLEKLLGLGVDDKFEATRG